MIEKTSSFVAAMPSIEDRCIKPKKHKELTTMENLSSIRRDNLMALVMGKFKGNRAALSRATGVQPNHINLLLSSNDAHRRNLGEELAQRMEDALGLPPLWFDNPHDAESAKRPVNIAAHPVDASLSHILTTPDITSIGISYQMAESIKSDITAVENLFLSAVATSECSPHINTGDTVIVDGAIKAYSTDGVYLIARGQDTFLRHIRRSIKGHYTFSGGVSSERVASLKGYSIVSRIVKKLTIGHV